MVPAPSLKASAVNVRGGPRHQIEQALIDLACVRQHDHVGERFPLAKPATGRALEHHLVKAVLAERQVQPQLLGADAEARELGWIGDGEEAFPWQEVGLGAHAFDLRENVLGKRPISFGLGEQRLDLSE